MHFSSPRKYQFGQAGFFIISPDFVNIGSMRDDNLGTKNLMANQALDLLNKAFRGKDRHGAAHMVRRPFELIF